MNPETYAPHQALAAALLPEAFDRLDDPAHDYAHLARVWGNVCRIMAAEGGDAELLLAATLLHDCVVVEKDSPRRAEASRLAAQRARGVLARLGWRGERVAAVSHTIEAHSFSAGIGPETLEARILQDADRLDAMGFVGVARCFQVSGRLGRALYDADDPRAAGRDLDDGRFTLDHFPRKLLRLASGFETGEGARLAQERHTRLVTFFEGFLGELEAQ
jgi:uncharacterized protein